MMLMNERLQRHIHPPPRLALKTRAGLCAHAALHSPPRHVLLHALSPLELALVGPPDRQRDADDGPWDLGVSMAGVAADYVWWFVEGFEFRAAAG